MTKVTCPDCERSIPMFELETKTVAQTDGFTTVYQCPYCGADIEDPATHLA